MFAFDLCVEKRKQPSGNFFTNLTSVKKNYFMIIESEF